MGLADLLAVIGRGFRRLTMFSGRDAPRQFWPYVGCIVLGSMAIGICAFVPLMANAVERVQRFAAEHPDGISAGSASDPAAFGSDPLDILAMFRLFALGNAATSVAIVLLLAAAVSRRLHDRGLSGWWGMAPVPFLLFGVFAMPVLFGQMTGEPDMRLFAAIFLNNIVYLTTLVVLVIHLVQRGNGQINRFGAAP